MESVAVTPNTHLITGDPAVKVSPSPCIYGYL